MSTLGTIEIQMLADLARLRQDMDKAKSVVGGAMNTIKTMVGVAMAGFSARAFVGWIQGAIDAADAAAKMGQKLGIATKDVAGLQLAVKLAGADMQVMQPAMVAMARNAVLGKDAFKALGVTVRGTDGAFKSNKQLLYDLADAFQRMPDGINKTALATDIFSEAGVKLMPLLNAGSEGMKEMADQAERLGLVVSENTGKAAEQFNDTMALVGESTTGIAMRVAADLLPTLKGLAGTFLDSVTSGDKLANTAEVISTALKGLFTVGAVGVEVFNTLGKMLGGVAAAVISAFSGEFRQAQKILEESGRDIFNGWGATAKTVQDAWSGAGAATVDSALTISKALNGATLSAKELAAASEKAAAAQKAAFRELEAAAAARSAARQAEQRGIDAFQQAEEQRRSADVKSARDALAAAEFEYRTHGMLRSQIAAVTLERLRDKLAAFQAGSDNARAVEMEIEAQEKLIEVLRRGEMRDAALAVPKETATEWQKTADTIERSLTDALMQGFENGRGFAESFKSVLESTFKTMILRPVIQATVQWGMNGLQGVLGQAAGYLGGGSGGGASSLGGYSGLLMDAAGYSGATGALASAANYGAVYSGAAYGTGFGTSQSAMLAAQEAGMVSTAGSSAMASYAGWIGLAIAAGIQASKDYDQGFGAAQSEQLFGKLTGTTFGGREEIANDLLSKLGFSDKWASILSGSTAVAKIFGHAAPKITGSGIVGTLGGGSFTGQAYADVYEKGGLLRSSKSYQQFADLPADMGAALDSQANALLTRARDYAETLGIPVSALTQVSTEARIALGADAEKNAEAITAAMTEYATALAGSLEMYVASYQRAGETVEQALIRLSTLQGFSDDLNTLGGVFSRVATLGVNARESMIELAGGMDAFIGKALGFVQNYYTRDEIAGGQAREIRDAMADVGITQDLSSRADFRALVEGLDVGTAQGREQLATLLNVQQTFAGLADYLGEAGLTLQTAAQQAPDISMMTRVLEVGAADQVTATYSVRDAMMAVGDRIEAALERIGVNWPGTTLPSTPPASVEVNPYYNYGSDGP